MIKGIIIPVALMICMSGMTGTDLMAYQNEERPEGQSGLMSSFYTASEDEDGIITLAELLRSVEQNFRVTFLYEKDLVEGKMVKGARPEREMKEKTAGRELSGILNELGFTYHQVDEETYVILAKGAGTPPLTIQETVTGTVTDSETGEALPGVSIVVGGSNMGTTTDLNGKFELEVHDPTVTLVFSYVGYLTQEVDLDGKTEILINLKPTAIMGDELVVVGYGEARQRDVTGSVTSVQAEQLTAVARNSVNQMLQGRVPGMNMRTRSAQPGGGVSVNIRGGISPGGSNTPLYVIDGVPMTSYNSTVPGLRRSDLGFTGGIDRDPLSYLNPSDIESITVMKDASAAAIYGSAASNGVVLITTRGGRSGSLEVEYRGSYSIQSPKEYFPLLNARQYMQEHNRLSYDFYLYDAGLPPYGDNDPNSASPFVPFFSQSDISGSGLGTDWVDLVSRTGSIQEHNVTMSGGTEHTRIYSSFGIHDNQAILKNSTYTRYTGRINLDQTITDGVEFRVRLNLGQQDGQNATSGESVGGPEKYHMLEAATSFAPTIGVYNDDGSYTQHYNPLIMNPVSFKDVRDQSRTNNLFLAPTLQVNASENFQANLVGQVDRESTKRGFYLPRTSNHNLFPEGVAQKLESSRTNYAGEGFVTYQNSFENSDLTIVAGAGIYYAEEEGFQVEAVGFFTDAFQDHRLSVAHNLEGTRLDSYRYDQTKISQFMRINYSLYNRYVITLVGRRDGSSVFAENYKYGFFPGISTAWILTEESFLREQDMVSELKLRVGYGQSGNESVLGRNTFQLYSPGNQYVIGNTLYSGVALSQIANPDLTWETVTTLNAGLDFGFFRNRLRGSLDVFQKTATNLLQFNPLPFNSPVGSVADNVGTTRSHGIELSLNSLNVSTPMLSWNTDFNLSWSEARWIERNPRVPLDPWVDERDLLGTIYGVQTAGIIRSEADIPAHQPNANLGNLIYVDQNGDGVLNNEDIVILGNDIPKWSLGFRNEIAYRNLSLSFYAYGLLDFKRGNTYAPNGTDLRVIQNAQNTTVYVSEIWSHDNPDGTRPGVAPDPHAGDFAEGHDFNLYDASFIRIQDITLGYSLPQRFLTAVGGIREARLFLTVQNLGVITSYPGYDPEYTESNPYPHSYSTTMGIEVRF